MFKQCAFLCFFILISKFNYGEEPLILPENADCVNAIYIDTNVFGPTNPPEGYGDILEISGNHLGNPYFIQREHHTVWYYFDIQEGGNLTFDIVPESVSDDYDFLLFKYTDEQFCDEVAKQKIKPVRTNISRNNPEVDSRTGLSHTATRTHVPAGPGDDYSKALPVKKGERYYLLVDNVYDGGKGHTLYMHFPRNDLDIHFGLEGESVELSGQNAGVILSDAETGEVILDTVLNLKRINNIIPAPAPGNYYLSLVSQGYFHETKYVQVPKQNRGNLFSPEKIQIGRSAYFQHINFFPNQARVMPRSIQEIYRLYRTLAANPGLIVRIEGHVNAPHSDNLPFFQQLSDSRSETIRNFMIERGIEGERMEKIGYGNLRMLYPEPRNADEMRMNRRVEVRVIAFD